MNKSDHILQLKGVSKQYRSENTPALNAVDLNIYRGELMALVGASGSGKTTMLRLIAGLEQPDSGRILLDGQLLSDGSFHQKTKKRSVGLVFQQYALFPHLSVLQNVMFGLKPSGREKKRRALQLLEQVGLDSNPRKFPHQLSGGQQQRVALARAMAAEPKVLLLDEPFSHLDTALKDQVRADIRAIIKEQGMTAIFVTHDTRDALSTADRIAILKSGRLQQIGTPRQLYQQPVNSYVATFFGRQNRLPIREGERGFSTPFGPLSAETAATLHQVEGALFFRPEDVALCSDDLSALRGRVGLIQYKGRHQSLLLHSPAEGPDIQIDVHAHHEIALGDEVSFQFIDKAGSFEKQE